MKAARPDRFEALRIRSVSRSHAGCIRAVNEDRVLDRPEAALWAVADGMGGHRGGADAAARVVNALAGVEHGSSGYVFLADIARGLQAVNGALYSEKATAPASGSTLVALLAHEGYYACLWAGDSRAYQLRGGELVRITHDHSVVQQMVDRGVITEEERGAHPQGHLITRAVGMEPRLQLDRNFGVIAKGDTFILCSDGLTSCLDESDITARLGIGELSDVADALMASALARGAPDNVSLVLLSIS